MFRAAQVGPYDEIIAKATDENLTSEDWGAIMEVCDRVSNDPNGPKETVQSMIKRLLHRNANVQLYTLEVANALGQNCGKPMHRELASRAFTDAMLNLANNRNTHNQVRARIFERMKDWADMFKSDADLGIMYDAYYRLKQSHPTLHAPTAPQKNSLTDQDRQKEEDELKLALELSLQEEERKKKAVEPQNASSSADVTRQADVPQPVQPVPTGTTAATVSRVRALFDFVPSEPGELEFKKGDVIAVLESVYKDWWRGSLKGKTGIFPLNYVEKLTDPTPDELQREAQMEAEVFAEIKNVEKLLTLLSTNAAPREEDGEEISKLYHQTLAIRPKLIRLIEKYSQKKDDFTQLNEKFIKARRDYEALLEQSMSHPPQPTYHQYAVRPATVGPAYPGGVPNYAQQQAPPQQQDPQRFYTPGPQQDQPQYPQTTPSPNFQRPGPGAAGPAPFYMAGAEVPPQGAAPPAQHQQPPQQQQYPPRDQQQQQYPPREQQQQPPQQQQYPPRDQQQYPPRDQQQQYPPRQEAPRIPSAAAGKQPAPIQTSSPTPQPNQYSAYNAPPGNQRPQSTYGGAPQELSTSVYDSPIATHNPNPAATFPSSLYSPEEPHAGPSAPSAPSAPDPSQQRPGGYQPYSYQPGPQGSQPPPQSYSGHGYGNAEDSPAPPQPTNAAPPPPNAVSRPSVPLTPPPLQPSGPAFDARQTLPSQMISPPLGGAPPPPQQQPPQQPQYRAYVPPSNPQNEGPSAPGDYYRTAAY